MTIYDSHNKLSLLDDRIPKLFAHFEEQGEFYFVQQFTDSTASTP